MCFRLHNTTTILMSLSQRSQRQYSFLIFAFVCNAKALQVPFQFFVFVCNTKSFAIYLFIFFLSFFFLLATFSRQTGKKFLPMIYLPLPMTQATMIGLVTLGTLVRLGISFIGCYSRHGWPVLI